MTTVGGVKCWGSNRHGQLGDGTTTDRALPVNVVGLTRDVAAVSAGGLHTCALTMSGWVKCWGANGKGQLGDGTNTGSLTPVNASGLTSGVVDVSAGSDHSCALTTAGTLKCWGYNGAGKLGDGTDTPRNVPTDVVGLTNKVVLVSAGGNHTCAVTEGGGVKCWGGGGRLGNGTDTYSLTPVDVCAIGAEAPCMAANNSILRGVAAISLVQHTCALTKEGDLTCWGSNRNGQLGNGTNADSFIPVEVTGMGGGVAAFASALEHSCAITTLGSLKCWGGGYNTIPTDVPGVDLSIDMFDVVDIPTAGEQFTYNMEVTNNGPATATGVTLIDELPGTLDFVSATSPAAACMVSGGNVTCNFGDLHPGNTVTVQVVVIPIAVGTITNTATVAALESDSVPENNTATETIDVEAALQEIGANAISAGNYHTCALTTAGGVNCWGYSRDGQLGIGTFEAHPTPASVAGLTSTVAVSAGEDHTCALGISGRLKCWGGNSSGQLGDGTNTPSAVPVEVSGLSQEVTSVSAGGSHTCALTKESTVICWGANFYGQLGDGTNADSLSPLKVAGFSTAVTAVSLGELHTCALTHESSTRAMCQTSQAIWLVCIVGCQRTSAAVRPSIATCSLWRYSSRPLSKASLKALISHFPSNS